MSNKLLESVFRQQYGQIFALLSRRFGSDKFAAIEDAMQFAFIQAMDNWKEQGIPENPSAWLYKVTSRKLINELQANVRQAKIARNENVFQQKNTFQQEPSFQQDHSFHQESSLAAINGGELGTSSDINDIALKHEMNDALLRMMFLTCDARIPIESQIVFTLRTLCGFSISELTERLFISTDNVYKRFARAKKFFQSEFQSAFQCLDLSDEWEKQERLSGVLWVLYLIFTEGHLSANDTQVIRNEFCDDALRMTNIMTQHWIGTSPSTYALLALMQFHMARKSSRKNDAGGVMFLDEQDRKLWDKKLIMNGFFNLAKSAEGEELSRYHLEAGIAAEHCKANDYASTNWQRISEQYAVLEKICPSPLVVLNRAIALAEWKGPKYGLEILNKATMPLWMSQSYHWFAVKAWLLLSDGQKQDGLTMAQNAIEMVKNSNIKRLLIKRFSYFGY